MPTISSAGIGSGLDINGLVTQLVSAERAPTDAQLRSAQTKANTKISALGSLQGALSSLQDAAKALSSNTGLSAMIAQTGDSTILTASAGAGAVSGSFDIELVSLAQATKLISSAYASSATVVGNGTVTIASGTSSFTVTLSDGSNTLADLRSAINNSSDNTTVDASIVTDVNGTHLVLIGRQTGLSNAISITSSAASGGLEFIATTSQQSAQDAHIRVDGNDAYSATNTVSDVIDGVTLNLIKSNAGSTTTLTLSSNTSGVNAAINAFINSYNTFVKVSAVLGSYNVTTKVAGPLLGDNVLRGATQQLRSLLGGTVTGTGSAYSHLTELGITSNTDGSLKLDASKLSSALRQDATSVQKLFSADTGFATAIQTITANYLGSGGSIDTESQNLQARIKDVTKRQDALDRRMSAVEAHYRAEFTALDAMISKLRGTQDYLTQQLAGLANLNTQISNR